MLFLTKNLVAGVLFILFLDCSIAQNVHRYDFVLTESNFTKLCSTKSMLTVNQSFPGPTITARRGDLINVTVYNHGIYGVTIHWHGVKQPRNPWSDGPENITQCPIQPNTSFTQQIILSNEEGTLWWHAHSEWSRATVHGAIVILPPEGKTYPYPKPDFEQLIILGSWYKEDVHDIYNTVASTGDSVKSDAHTINGFTGNSTTCPSGEMYRMNVSSGKTYLLRIINAVMNEEQFLGIANHSMTLVGMDGAYTEPFPTDYLMITPGQTMDVLVTANQPPSHYYLVSAPYVDNTQIDYDNSSVKALIQYQGNYVPPSPVPSPSLPEVNDSNAAVSFTASLNSSATPDLPIVVPKNITRHILIAASMNSRVPNNPQGGTAASLNNISFTTPNTDILQAYYYNITGVFSRDFPDIPDMFDFTGNVTNVSDSTVRGTKAIMINYGEEVELVFQGTALHSTENHPMHLHGYSFYVVGVGPENWNNVTDPMNYNLINPPLVNTIGLPKLGWVAIRFIANNPGVWFMHCHLERHATWGMDTVLIVKNGTTPETSIRPPPDEPMPKCQADLN